MADIYNQDLVTSADIAGVNAIYVPYGSSGLSDSEAIEFMEEAWTEFNPQDVTVFYGILGVPDIIYLTRFSGDTIVQNAEFGADILKFVDANWDNVVGYMRFDGAYANNVALVFDSGSIVMFDATEVSPITQFANGDMALYNQLAEQWMLTNDILFSNEFWSTAIPFNATDFADNNILLSQAWGNTVIYNADGLDNIFFDHPLKDATFIDYDDNTVVFGFRTGELAVIETNSDYSPSFNFTSGDSYVLDRDADLWTTPQLVAQQMLEEAAWDSQQEMMVNTAEQLYADPNIANNLFVSRTWHTIVHGTDEFDVINLYDTSLSDVVAYSADDSAIALQFSNGTTLLVGSTGDTSPTFNLASGGSYTYNRDLGVWTQN
jgi:hypothetical protein